MEVEKEVRKKLGRQEVEGEGGWRWEMRWGWNSMNLFSKLHERG